MQRHWVLDFDETLASGSISWGLKHAFPRLIAAHQLPFDEARFHRAALAAQEQDSHETDPGPLLDALFDEMQWPRALAPALMQDILNNYQPELFEDALPFLERLQKQGDAVYILSNNPRTPQQVDRLGLGHHFSLIFTPKQYPGSQPKPHISLWEIIAAAVPGLSSENTVMVGDDPWTDGAFAARVGIPCWIIDRMDRFESLDQTQTYRRVLTLNDILLNA